MKQMLVCLFKDAKKAHDCLIDLTKHSDSAGFVMILQSESSTGEILVKAATGSDKINQILPLLQPESKNRRRLNKSGLMKKIGFHFIQRLQDMGFSFDKAQEYIRFVYHGFVMVGVVVPNQEERTTRHILQQHQPHKFASLNVDSSQYAFIDTTE